MYLCIIASNKLMFDCCCAFLFNVHPEIDPSTIDVITPFRTTVRPARLQEMISVIKLAKQRRMNFLFRHVFKKLNYQIVLTAEPTFPNHISGKKVIMIGHSPVHLKYMKKELYPYIGNYLKNAKFNFDEVVYLESIRETYEHIKYNYPDFSDIIQFVGSSYFDVSAFSRESYNTKKVHFREGRKNVLVQSTWGESLIEGNFDFFCYDLPRILPDFDFYYSLHPNYFNGPHSKRTSKKEILLQVEERSENIFLVRDDVNKISLISNVDLVISDHTSLVALGAYFSKRCLVFHHPNSQHDKVLLHKICRDAVHVYDPDALAKTVLDFITKPKDQSLDFIKYAFKENYQSTVRSMFSGNF